VVHLSVRLRRAAGRLGWFLPPALIAVTCLPILADEVGRTGLERVNEEPAVGCADLWETGGPPRSFERGGSDFGSVGSRPEWSLQPAPGGFSLCAGPGGEALPERSELRWEPLAPAPDPREPLRGVRNANAPYGRKFWRGLYLITGAEIASGLILAAMPKESTNWDEDPFDHALSNFGDAWTKLPVWDPDMAFHNWFGHPYAGAFYYNMMRSQGGTVRQSFAFSVLHSVMWEYGLEAFAEQPSIQDLVATPFIGAVVGELFHRWSVAIVRKGDLNLGQKVLVFLLNPAYVMNNGYRSPE
jgi:hypothetical protein